MCFRVSEMRKHRPEIRAADAEQLQHQTSASPTLPSDVSIYGAA